jgi:hypothetical protein
MALCCGSALARETSRVCEMGVAPSAGTRESSSAKPLFAARTDSSSDALRSLRNASSISPCGSFTAIDAAERPGIETSATRKNAARRADDENDIAFLRKRVTNEVRRDHLRGVSCVKRHSGRVGPFGRAVVKILVCSADAGLEGR